METAQPHLLKDNGDRMLLFLAVLTTIASKRLKKLPSTILMVFVGIIILKL